MVGMLLLLMRTASLKLVSLACDLLESVNGNSPGMEGTGPVVSKDAVAAVDLWEIQGDC